MDKDLIALEEYLIQHYEVVELNSSIKKKLSNAFNSEVHVDPHHLLQLWKSLETNLRKIRAQNIAKGQAKDGNLLLMYEMAVVLNHYPKYIKKIGEIEKQEKDVKDMKEFISMVNTIKSQPPKHEMTNVSDMVDEIFFSDSEE